MTSGPRRNQVDVQVHTKKKKNLAQIAEFQ